MGKGSNVKQLMKEAGALRADIGDGCCRLLAAALDTPGERQTFLDDAANLRAKHKEQAEEMLAGFQSADLTSLSPNDLTVAMAHVHFFRTLCTVESPEGAAAINAETDRIGRPVSPKRAKKIIEPFLRGGKN